MFPSGPTLQMRKWSPFRCRTESYGKTRACIQRHQSMLISLSQSEFPFNNQRWNKQNCVISDSQVLWFWHRESWSTFSTVSLSLSICECINIYKYICVCESIYFKEIGTKFWRFRFKTTYIWQNFKNKCLICSLPIIACGFFDLLTI